MMTYAYKRDGGKMIHSEARNRDEAKRHLNAAFNPGDRLLIVWLGPDGHDEREQWTVPASTPVLKLPERAALAATIAETVKDLTAEQYRLHAELASARDTAQRITNAIAGLQRELAKLEAPAVTTTENDPICPGRYYNTAGKRAARCGECGHLDYEANEGDRCRSDGPAVPKFAPDDTTWRRYDFEPAPAQGFADRPFWLANIAYEYPGYTLCEFHAEHGQPVLIGIDHEGVYLYADREQYEESESYGGAEFPERADRKVGIADGWLVRSVRSDQTGGGCMVDVLEFKNGWCATVTVDHVALWPSIELYENVGDELWAQEQGFPNEFYNATEVGGIDCTLTTAPDGNVPWPAD